MNEQIIIKLNTYLDEVYVKYEIPLMLRDADLVYDSDYKCYFAYFSNAKRDSFRVEFSLACDLMQVRKYDKKTGYWLES